MYLIINSNFWFLISHTAYIHFLLPYLTWMISFLITSTKIYLGVTTKHSDHPLSLSATIHCYIKLALIQTSALCDILSKGINQTNLQTSKQRLIFLHDSQLLSVIIRIKIQDNRAPHTLILLCIVHVKSLIRKMSLIKFMSQKDSP